MAKAKEQNVLLVATDVKEEVESKFPIAVANKLLKLSNTKWKLADSDFEWNGTELAVADKPKKKATK